MAYIVQLHIVFAGCYWSAHNLIQPPLFKLAKVFPIHQLYLLRIIILAHKTFYSQSSPLPTYKTQFSKLSFSTCCHFLPVVNVKYSSKWRTFQLTEWVRFGVVQDIKLCLSSTYMNRSNKSWLYLTYQTKLAMMLYFDTDIATSKVKNIKQWYHLISK